MHRFKDLSLVSIVTCGTYPDKCMVVTVINSKTNVVFTLPAVPYVSDNFSDSFDTNFKGLKGLLECLGFTVDDLILGDDIGEGFESLDDGVDSSS
jgi:hypothetical protein